MRHTTVAEEAERYPPFNSHSRQRQADIYHNLALLQLNEYPLLKEGLPQVTDEKLRALREIGLLHTLRNITKSGEFDRPTKASEVLWVDLNGMPITDVGLKELTVFENLTTLSLSGTKVSDAGMKELQSFKKLTHLHLNETTVTDAGLQELIHLSKLNWLYLKDTEVTDAGIAAFRKKSQNCAVTR